MITTRLINNINLSDEILFYYNIARTVFNPVEKHMVLLNVSGCRRTNGVTLSLDKRTGSAAGAWEPTRSG